MWLTSLGLALLTIAASPSSGGGLGPRSRVAPAAPRLTAALFTERWPTTFDEDEIEKPHRREKLRRLVQITPDADPDKARFWMLLAAAETARWRAEQGRADEIAARIAAAPAAERAALQRERELLVGRAAWSWEAAVAAYDAAAKFPSFERRDATLYWLARLHLARAAETSPR